MERHRILTLSACLALALLGVVLNLSTTSSVSGPAVPLTLEPKADKTSAPSIVNPGEVAVPAKRTSVSVTPATNAAAARVTSEANSQTGGTVYGRVLDQDEVGVPGVGVRLYRRGSNVDQVSDAEGRYTFDGLDAGGYRLLVNIRLMPEGFLPPWRQEQLRKYSGRATGLFGTAFELTQNKSRKVDLRVFAESSVSGKLVGPTGEPIAMAPVRILSDQGITGSTRTDATGNYVLAAVYPGKYVASALFNSVNAAHSSISSSSSPLPIHFEITAGETLELDDLIAGVGGHTLRGSVADQYGNPVGFLAVRCVVVGAQPSPSWETVTDRAGLFELGRVPSAVLSLTVGHDEQVHPARTSRLAKQVAPIRINARRSKRAIEVPGIEVEVTNQFRLFGEVRVDPSWGKTNQLESASIRVEVDGVDATHLLDAERRGTVRLGPNWSFEFEWNCATPRAEFELRIVLVNDVGQEHVKRVSVQPIADSTEEVLIAFP